MAFTNYPPVTTGSGTDTQDYGWRSQIVKALDEVAAAAANGLYPPTTTLWDGNLIGTLTATTLTDSTKNWAVYRTDLGTVKRWTQWAPDPSPSFTSTPTQFDVVLLKLFDGGQWDWPRMLRIPITDQNWITSGTSPVSNQITFAPAIDTTDFPLSYYTHYFIVRTGGPFVHDRVPEWPNDMTLEWANAISTTTTTITIDGNKRNWSKNQWATKWVYFTVAGNVRSAQIVTNDIDTSGNHVLHFAAIAAAPDVAVIGILSASGLYWNPNHQPQVPDNEIASLKVAPKTLGFGWARR